MPVLVEAHDLQVDESLLTGESVPVRKRRVHRAEQPRWPRPGGDDLPFVFSGTLVVRGAGRGRSHCDRRRERDRQDRPVAQCASRPSRRACSADRAGWCAFSRVRQRRRQRCWPSLLYGFLRGDWLEACWPASRSACRCCRRSFPSS